MSKIIKIFMKVLKKLKQVEIKLTMNNLKI